MKKYILLLILCAFAIQSKAQTFEEKLKLSEINTEVIDDNIRVSFTVDIDRKAFKGGNVIAYVPVITDGSYKVSLPAIVSQNRRARIAWQRHEWTSGIQADYDNSIYLNKKGTLDYSAEVPFQWWMHDSRIEVEKVMSGCCNSEIDDFVLAANILPKPEPVPTPEPEPIVIIPEPTVTEQLAEAMPFVLPSSEFDPEQPIKFYDDERDNALTVYYKINSYDIEPDYAGNDQTLTNLLAAIDIITKSKDTKIEYVVVAGFASPEGPFDFNDRLAWERAVSVKEYILRNTEMKDSDVKLFNGSADWRGLYLLVEKDRLMPEREIVLDIIEGWQTWDIKKQGERMAMLRNLNGGKTYRYLAENIFPELRNGAFIRVYFNETTN